MSHTAFGLFIMLHLRKTQNICYLCPIIITNNLYSLMRRTFTAVLLSLIVIMTWAQGYRTITDISYT